MSDDIVARLRAWYWYPTKPAHEAADEIVRLREEVLRLRGERDEARREWCTRVALQTTRKPRVIASNRGWDCFAAKEAR